jgi:hypothetical protein
VFIDRDRGRLLAVDGEFLDLETQESVDAGALHVERSRGGVRVVDGDGNVVSVDIFAGSHLNVIVTPSDEGPWRGLMGNRNGDPNDEFQTREGEDLGSRPDYQTIAGVFADSWRITSQESLFEYDPGETTETFANARFPVAYPDEPLREVLTAQVNRSAQAEAVCRLAGITDPDLLAECAFDFQVSGNVSFVRASARVERSVSLDLTASTVPTPPTAPTVQADPASDERFTVGPARLTEISGADLATGAGLVLVRAADEDNRIILRAFDIETRALRWSAADVDASCGPVVMEGLGVAALVAHGSERLGADRSALVLLSLEDGSELARFVGDGEDVLVGCPATLNASGDVVIHIANSQARGFRIGDDITLLWRHEFEGPVGGHSPAVDGHFVVNSFLPGEGDGVAVTSLDAETGEVSSAIALPGRLTRSSPAAIEPVGDGRLAISTNGNLNVDPALALVDASSGGLDVIWVQTFRQGFGAVPQAMRLDDQVVGWSDRGEGLRLAGFSLATGEWIWSHIPEGSGTPGDVAVVGDDTVVISAHAVAWLEYVDGETRRWRVVDHPEHPERYSQPQQITVVADRTIVVTGATHDGGFYVEFVDVGTVR